MLSDFVVVVSEYSDFVLYGISEEPLSPLSRDTAFPSFVCFAVEVEGCMAKSTFPNPRVLLRDDVGACEHIGYRWVPSRLKNEKKECNTVYYDTIAWLMPSGYTSSELLDNIPRKYVKKLNR